MRKLLTLLFLLLGYNGFCQSVGIEILDVDTVHLPNSIYLKISSGNKGAVRTRLISELTGTGGITTYTYTYYFAHCRWVTNDGYGFDTTIYLPTKMPFVVNVLLAWDTNSIETPGCTVHLSPQVFRQERFPQAATGVGGTRATTSGAIIAPNPTNTCFTIEGAKGASAVITNTLGHQAKQLSISSDKQNVDISALPAGRYVLQITDAKGTREAMSILKQ